MQVHQELEVVGEPDAINRFVDEVTASLADGWTRDEASEKRMGNSPYRGYCFRRPRGTGMALLWLSADRDGHRLWLSNIVPDGKRIERDEYNAIVIEFHDRFTKPAADRTGVTTKLSKADVDLRDLLSEGEFKALDAFSKLANRSMLHPLDRDRWWTFIVSTHQRSTDVPIDLLERWFTEVERWPEEEASDLAGEYERLRSFLAFYDARR